jgi:hypothetical protein
MDPYINTLDSLHNLKLRCSGVPQSNVNLTFLPNAWSGANLTSSTQPWPFVFLVRSPLFLLPYYVLNFMFKIDSQAILLWQKAGMESGGVFRSSMPDNQRTAA